MKRSSQLGNRKHVILVSGCSRPMLREWPGNEIGPEFVAALPEARRPLISSSESWHGRRNTGERANVGRRHSLPPTHDRRRDSGTIREGGGS